jgi:7-cyano-7-deazaguanine synthase
MTDEAVVLMSGGPDSFAAADWALEAGFDARGLFFDVGHEVAETEFDRFRRQTEHLDIEGERLGLYDLRSALGANDPDPEHFFKGHGLELFPFSAGITTSIATSYALSNDVTTLVLGLHADDFEQNDEYTPERVRAVAGAAGDVEVCLPFADLSKLELIERARERDLPVETSWSCTRNARTHCGECVQCRERAAVLGDLYGAGRAESSDNGRQPGQQ